MNRKIFQKLITRAFSSLPELNETLIVTKSCAKVKSAYNIHYFMMEFQMTRNLNFETEDKAASEIIEE